MTSPACTDSAVEFRCGENRLWGVLSRPADGPEHATGVLIVVGGPQYRVGSQRQFVLLARRLAAAGFPTLRFDCGGMGDSDGPLRTFEQVQPDVDAAMQALRRHCSGVQRIVLWGLCDGASAALMQLPTRADIAGLVIVNPWVRSEASLAAATVKHYYARRFVDPAFWSKLLHGGFDWRGSAAGLWKALRQAGMARRRSAHDTTQARAPFQTRMARGLAGFGGRVLLVIAGEDLTAREFLQVAATAPDWRGLLERPLLERVDVPGADHTFSCRAWREKLEEATLAWLCRLGDASASTRSST